MRMRILPTRFFHPHRLSQYSFSLPLNSAEAERSNVPRNPPKSPKVIFSLLRSAVQEPQGISPVVEGTGKTRLLAVNSNRGGTSLVVSSGGAQDKAHTSFDRHSTAWLTKSGDSTQNPWYPRGSMSEIRSNDQLSAGVPSSFS